MQKQVTQSTQWMPGEGSGATTYRIALAFALITLLIGTVPAALSFALDPETSTRIGLDVVPVPAWGFSLVWLIAYPCMGVATWLVWRRRDQVDVSVPLVVFGAAFLQTLSFWFANSIRMIAVMDGTGVVLACMVAWVYMRYERGAIWWLLPWLVWMPITFAIKLWVLSGATW